MFNLNSPIMQEMLRKNPPPPELMKGIYGNTPKLETVVTRSPDAVSASDPNQVVATTECPFPSPKEMVMNAGMQQQPMGMMPMIDPMAPPQMMGQPMMMGPMMPMQMGPQGYMPMVMPGMIPMQPVAMPPVMPMPMQYQPGMGSMAMNPMQNYVQSRFGYAAQQPLQRAPIQQTKENDIDTIMKMDIGCYSSGQKHANPNPNGTNRYVGSIQSLMSGYSNPYMGIGTYAGMQPENPTIFQVQSFNEDQRAIYQCSLMSGLTYNDQLQATSDVMKKMSICCSHYRDVTAEEAAKRASRYDIKYVDSQKPMTQEELEKNAPWNKKSALLKVRGMRGDEVVIPTTTYRETLLEDVKDPYRRMEVMYKYDFAMMAYVDAMNKMNEIARHNALYEQAIERKYDKVEGGLPGFFNGGMGEIANDMFNNKIRKLLTTQATTQMYNQQEFKKRLYANNNIMNPGQKRYLARMGPIVMPDGKIQGANGIMPDGRPVSPGVDPTIADSFVYDQKTGTIEIHAPDFQSRQIDEARNKFMAFIHNPPRRNM